MPKSFFYFFIVSSSLGENSLRNRNPSANTVRIQTTEPTPYREPSSLAFTIPSRNHHDAEPSSPIGRGATILDSHRTSAVGTFILALAASPSSLNLSPSLPPIPRRKPEAALGSSFHTTLPILTQSSPFSSPPSQLTSLSPNSSSDSNPSSSPLSAETSLPLTYSSRSPVVIRGERDAELFGVVHGAPTPRPESRIIEEGSSA